jgi:hypothetical protein
LETLDTKDQAILVAAIANQEWTSNALARELTSRGIVISDKPITIHRRKACSCAR